jgi:hypothetical protein
MERFEVLKGKVLTDVVGGIGDDSMVFTTQDGEKYELYYEHD